MTYLGVHAWYSCDIVNLQEINFPLFQNVRKRNKTKKYFEVKFLVVEVYMRTALV